MSETEPEQPTEPSAPAPRRAEWKLNIRPSGVLITLGALLATGAAFLAVIFVAGNSTEAKLVDESKNFVTSVTNSDCEALTKLTTAKARADIFSGSTCTAVMGDTPINKTGANPEYHVKIVSSNIGDSKATLVLQFNPAGSGQNKGQATFVFVKEGDSWKIDSFKRP